MTESPDWLGRTIEHALDPEVPICDPHHHLWDHPEHRYLVPEFLADIAGGHRLERTVYVECQRAYRTGGPQALRPVGETEFVHALTAPLQKSAEGVCIAVGIVGFADLALGSAVHEVLLAHLQASDRFRGVRHATAWDPDHRIHAAHTNPPAGLLGDPLFRQGFSCLRPLGLSFDAWLYHHQIPELAALARAFPEVPIVLNHAGGPVGIGPYKGRRDEVFEAWRRNMVELATCDNVFVKLGGLSMKLSGFDWHKRAAPPNSAELAEAIRPYCETCIEHFGSGRCMFESNFPVDRVSCPYTVLWNAFKRLVGAASPTERAQLLNETATRVYRLNG
jgi:L-fuconolactonase